jgi:hypothetical protein
VRAGEVSFSSSFSFWVNRCTAWKRNRFWSDGSSSKTKTGQAVTLPPITANRLIINLGAMISHACASCMVTLNEEKSEKDVSNLKASM